MQTGKYVWKINGIFPSLFTFRSFGLVCPRPPLLSWAEAQLAIPLIPLFLSRWQVGPPCSAISFLSPTAPFSIPLNRNRRSPLPHSPLVCPPPAPRLLSRARTRAPFLFPICSLPVSALVLERAACSPRPPCAVPSNWAFSASVLRRVSLPSSPLSLRPFPKLYGAS